MATDVEPSSVLEAIRAGRLSKLKELLTRSPHLVSWKSSFTVNWLWYAASCSSVEVVRYLLEDLELDPDESHSEFGNALWSAAQAGKTDVVEYLLGRGVGLQVDEPERNPLLAAVSGDGPPILVRRLLEAGVNSRRKYWLRGADEPMGAIERALEQGRPDLAKMITDWNELHVSK